LTATQHIANEIASGTISIGIAVGAETLSQGNVRLERPFVDEIMTASQDAADCMQPMGQTSENVAREFNVSREEQDRYAVESYQRAERAQREGWFGDEIVPITVKVKGKEGPGVEQDVEVKQDDVRYGTTYEGISKLKPAFPEFGDRSHAGNSSQVTDGAAAAVLMKRSKAEELNLPVLAKYVGTALAGLEPRIMVSLHTSHLLIQLIYLSVHNTGLMCGVFVGHRSHPRDPQTPAKVQSRSGRYRRNRNQRSLRLNGCLLS
jgi:acetyl-CoA acetyltransferase